MGWRIKIIMVIGIEEKVDKIVYGRIKDEGIVEDEFEIGWIGEKNIEMIIEGRGCMRNEGGDEIIVEIIEEGMVLRGVKNKKGRIDEDIEKDGWERIIDKIVSRVMEEKLDGERIEIGIEKSVEFECKERLRKEIKRGEKVLESWMRSVIERKIELIGKRVGGKWVIKSLKNRMLWRCRREDKWKLV